MKQLIVLILACIFIFSCNKSENSQSTLTVKNDSIYIKDYNQYWNIINDYFAYFDAKKTDWAKVKEMYQPVVDTISNEDDFIHILEKSNNELYNFHISLNRNTMSSSKLVPTSTDIWAKYEQGKFYIEAIRENSKLEQTDLKVGMEILAYNNTPIAEAVVEFLPKSFTDYDAESYAFAANTLLAGKHNTERTLKVLIDESPTNVDMPYSNYEDYNTENTLVTTQLLDGNIGYIRINNALGNMGLIKDFDQALDGMMDANGLILDLRETPSGGNNTVAKAIMGRFIDVEKPYQRYRYVLDEKETGIEQIWIELVLPRGKTYSKPLVVLVGRWTGSMGEGICIGFDGMQRAEIIGTEMAKLIGGVWNYSLDETRIGFQIPGIKTYHINKSLREDFVPKHGLTYNSEYMEIAMKLLR